MRICLRQVVPIGSGESVFDIQRTISGSQVITNSIEGSWHTAPPGGMGTSGWGFYQPSYELVNSHIVDESGLPYLDKSYQDKPALTTLTDNIPHTDLEVLPILVWISVPVVLMSLIGTGRFLLSWMGGYVISRMVVLI